MVYNPPHLAQNLIQHRFGFGLSGQGQKDLPQSFGQKALLSFGC
jgi:hypothetical protein